MTDDVTTRADLELVGDLDGLDQDGQIAGWLWSPSEPTIKRRILVLADGLEVAQTTADLPRADLANAGVGDGAHAFRISPPASVMRPGATTLFSLRDAATGRQVFAEIPVIGAAAVITPPAAPAERSLTGNIDQVTNDGWITGWCWYPTDPDVAVDLTVLVDGDVAGAMRANLPRPDLAQAGIGDGAHGFSYALPWRVMAEKGSMTIAVRDTRTGESLGVPVTLGIGLRSAADARIEDLERQVRMLRAELDLFVEQARGRDEDRAARELFRTVGAFFHDLADTPAQAGFAAAGLRGTLADFTERHAPLVLAVPDAPDATILLHADAAPDDVHRVLAALISTSADRRADVVLLDEGAGGAEMALMPAVVRNLRYHRAAASPVAARSEAVSSARAPVVVFLSARMIPREGWLDVLLATLSREFSADIVGARTLRGDGNIEAAGMSVSSNLALHLISAGANPDAPENRVLRCVDAVGDAAAAVRRDAVALSAGFASGIEDVAVSILDLCLSTRRAGRRVLLQPHAELVRLGAGGPGPTDAEQLSRLRRIWRTKPLPKSEAGFVGHALVVDRIVPRPDRDAGSVIILEQMLALRDLGWRVTYAAAEAEIAEPGAVALLEQRGIEVVRPPHYASVTDFLREHGASLGLVVVGRYAHAKMLFERIGALAPLAKRVFLPHDLHFLREDREAALNGSTSAGSGATKAEEIACVEAADATLVHSDHELDLLSREVSPDKLHLLRWIVDVYPVVAPFAPRQGVCFVGGFLHPPNVDGVAWFVEKVVPVLRKERPGLVFNIVGSNPPERIAALAAPDVVIHGWLADLAAMLGSVRLTVAPLRYGAGFKGKVATSLAAGVPVVATPVAVEGTGLESGQGVLVADDPQAFATAIMRLYDDSILWAEQSERGRASCRALYSPEAARGIWRGLLERLGLPARAG